MTTEESNKLIAEFMGFKITNFKNQLYIEQNLDLYYSIDTIYNDFDELGFNQSWDWLMPVIDKIEKFEDSFYIIHSTYFNKRCVCIKVEHNRRFENIEIYFNSPSEKFQATYQAVVRFIKWYNQD